MSEILLTSNDADVGAALGELGPPTSAVMFLERVPPDWLDSGEVADGIRMAAYDSTTDWQCWERGRVFCDEWELRWEGQSAVYTGAPVTLTRFVQGPDLPGAPRLGSYYLWGVRDGNRFLELQIPRALTYPVTSGRRVKVRVAEWRDEDGELVTSRFMGLEGVD